MTLGGLALAVGILVDERQSRSRTFIRRWSMLLPWHGRSGWATANRNSTASGHAVYSRRVHPLFFYAGGGLALFVPLSLAVGFSMLASYILSSTFVRSVSTWLLKQLRIRQSPIQPVSQWTACADFYESLWDHWSDSTSQSLQFMSRQCGGRFVIGMPTGN